MQLLQVNLQTGFGGGEIYTCFLGKALRTLGRSFDLVVHRNADWWRTHETGAARVHAVGSAAEIPQLPFARPASVLFHTPDRGETPARLKAQRCRLAALVHMPAYQRAVGHLAEYDRLFAVSKYVLNGLLAAGLAHTHPEPLYGVAFLEGRGASSDPSIVATSRYSWDTRKVRDRLLARIHPFWQAMQPQHRFGRRHGLTLGIVSRLTPIKQYPALFRALAPVLADFPQVLLEIFGSGGYASVRDLQAELAPLGDRVRWWGHQENVALAYRQLDYLLTGLPEKEALGLNILEAQMCGTPVLAPDAPPFTETMVHAQSGYLYPDPRNDSAAGFRRLLAELASGGLPRPDPRKAVEHLASFSEDAFRGRIARALQALESRS